MKTPEQINKELSKLEKIRDSLDDKGERETVLRARFDAKVDVLRWVLSEDR